MIYIASSGLGSWAVCKSGCWEKVCNWFRVIAVLGSRTIMCARCLLHNLQMSLSLEVWIVRWAARQQFMHLKLNGGLLFERMIKGYESVYSRRASYKTNSKYLTAPKKEDSSNKATVLYVYVVDDIRHEQTRVDLYQAADGTAIVDHHRDNPYSILCNNP